MVWGAAQEARVLLRSMEQFSNWLMAYKNELVER